MQLPGLRKPPEKAVDEWSINPIWFGLMTDTHPRWSVSDAHCFDSYVTGHLPRTHPLVENVTLDDRALEGV